MTAVAGCLRRTGRTLRTGCLAASLAQVREGLRELERLLVELRGDRPLPPQPQRLTLMQALGTLYGAMFRLEHGGTFNDAERRREDRSLVSPSLRLSLFGVLSTACSSPLYRLPRSEDPSVAPLVTQLVDDLVTAPASALPAGGTGRRLTPGHPDDRHHQRRARPRS